MKFGKKKKSHKRSESNEMKRKRIGYWWIGLLEMESRAKGTIRME